MAILKRGKPEKGHKLYPVHLRDKEYAAMRRAQHMPFHQRVICGNGSFHVFHTDDVSEVTCAGCKERLCWVTDDDGQPSLDAAGQPVYVIGPRSVTDNSVTES